MQETWRDSDDKCTFIVLDKELLDAYVFDEDDEIDAMVGDANLFLSTSDDGEKVAEAEIMIAEVAARGRGLGKEATALMLDYGANKLGVAAFEARIKAHNARSIREAEGGEAVAPSVCPRSRFASSFGLVGGVLQLPFRPG